MSTFTDNNGILEMTMDSDYEPDPQGFSVHCFNKMKQFCNKIAQVDAETNKSDTYGEILINSIRIALKMKSIGVTDEDVVSLCTGINRETYYAYIATVFLGAKLANLDPIIPLDDMKYLINLSKPKIIFCVPESVEKLETAINILNLNCKLIVFGGSKTHITFKECLLSQEGEEEFSPKPAKNLMDTVAILYSSGTTGMPKGVCITHYGILFMVNILKEYFDFSTVLFYTSPYWISYLIQVNAALECGGHRVLCKFDEKTFINTIQDFKVTVTFLPPSFTYAVTSYAENCKDHFDTSSLTTFLVGGSCIGQQQLEKLYKLFSNSSLVQGYGLTEISGFFSIFHPIKNENLLKPKAISCGRMLPDTIAKIMDIETKKILGPNQPGELLIKSKRVTSGYYKDPEKTAEAIDEDGFLHTGDVLYYDEDYCFYVVDRIKEMFKYKSWHVIPSELENILLKYPGVKEVLVLGYPHEEDGDRPMAVIVPKDGINLSEADIIHFIDNQVADYKKLRGGIKFASSLPRTTTGKFSRMKMRQMVINNEI